MRGLRRPLPVAAATGFAWLEKSGQAALDAAAKSYDSECARNAYLMRVFPDFDALRGDGEFERLAGQLLRPLDLALNNKPCTDA